MKIQGKIISESILLCSDGKYRWTYEVSLYKNPAIFLLVWKIFFFVTLGIFTFIIALDVIDWGWNMENMLGILKIFVYFTIGMTVLTGVSYLLYALIMGGKYRVLFEMDEKGINHVQLPEQAKKARAISALTVLGGLLSRRVTTVGVGLNAARTEMYSDFSRVRAVKAFPSAHLIKVNGRFLHNQVYSGPEDFNFVLNYIRAHCPNAK